MMQAGHDLVLLCDNDPGARQVCVHIFKAEHILPAPILEFFVAAVSNWAWHVSCPKFQTYQILCHAGVKTSFPRRHGCRGRSKRRFLTRGKPTFL